MLENSTATLSDALWLLNGLRPVNETLSRQFSVADDGLSDAERAAYDHCRPLSCKHEACYKRYMYSKPAKQRENCAPLFEEWKRCFELRRAALEQPPR